MKNALVTAVMAAFNAERTIVESIGSVMTQSMSAIELIVCDDASTDRTNEKIERIHDPRITLLKNKRNIGPGLSRDRAIQRALSPWIALVDADDAWHPDRLRRLIAAAESTDADVVFDDTLVCHDTAAGLTPWKPLHGSNAFGGSGNVARDVRIEDYITSDRLLIHPIVRSDFIRKHGICHSTRRFAEDAEFYMRLAWAGATFCYLPEPLYLYRITPGSLTAQAKDPSLMRECLTECSRWEGWSSTVQEAFEIKVGALRRNEMLYELSRMLRGGGFIRAFNLLMSEPHLLATLPLKLAQQLRYHAHRIMNGGICR